MKLSEDFYDDLKDKSKFALIFLIAWIGGSILFGIFA